MRYLFIILFIAGCSSTKQPSIIPKNIHDTIYIEAPSEKTASISALINDTVYLHNEKKYDSIYSILRKKNDTLLNERFKIERVKYYTKIVQHNSSQLKFLVGWINRAVKD